MNFENCPNWICNQQGIPYDYVYFLTNVLIVIPYLILAIYLSMVRGEFQKKKVKVYSLVATKQPTKTFTYEHRNTHRANIE